MNKKNIRFINFLFILSIVLLFAGCKQESTHSESDRVDNLSSTFENHNKELDAAIGTLRDLKYKFYANAFQVESFKCSNYGLELELIYTINNYTAHDIQAIVCKVFFSDKLGNDLGSSEIIIYDKIVAGKTMRRKDKINTENVFGLCSFKQNEVEIVVTPPSVIERNTNQPINTVRTSNVIISFSDGVEVYAHDYDFRFYQRRSDRIEEAITLIENLIRRLQPV